MRKIIASLLLFALGGFGVIDLCRAVLPESTFLGPLREFRVNAPVVQRRPIVLALKAGAVKLGTAKRSTQRETASMATFINEVLRFKGEGRSPVAVFDIDNTVLAMNQSLGSDQWFDHQYALIKVRTKGDKSAFDRQFEELLKLQGRLYAASGMHLPEADTASGIARLQGAGVTVFFLTSRGHAYAEATLRELRANGIRPKASGPGRDYAKFKDLGMKRSGLYRDGVFFTAGQHKGRMMQLILAKTGISNPDLVFFIDDKGKHVTRVYQSMKPTVEVHSFRYSAEDANVRAFREDGGIRIAEKQLKIFRAEGRIVSDAEAR